MKEVNLEKRFQEIYEFLKRYQSVYDVEYLKRYPSPFEDYISTWINELKGFSMQDLAKFESYPHDDNLENKDFKVFINKIRTLTEINKFDIEEADIPNGFLRKLNTKKRHEVRTLKKFFTNNSRTQTIIDIGAGAGHLSCALIENTKKNSICIDMNPELQESGLKKIKRWHPEIKDQIQFVESFFESETQINQDFNKDDTTVVGLHSCGPLSVSLIEFGVSNNLKEIISFGCCYHKIKSEYNLSKQGKTNSLILSNNALHLASRSGAVINESDLKKRLKIKSYRYALHYFLYDNFQIDFYSIGNSHSSDFEQNFSFYAKKYHRGRELEDISDQILDVYFNSKEVQERIYENFLADMIRMQFGRLLELYLLIDRALYLNDHGRAVKVFELFDKELSPRNIAIFSCEKQVSK